MQDNILLIIKQDNVQEFSKIYEQYKSVSIGRFPILSLCYLYDARKIVKQYEKELLQEKSYERVSLDLDIFSDFRKVAGRCIRLYANGEIVHPLEMLLILGKVSRLEKVYSYSYKTNNITENLKLIQKIKTDEEINPTETIIKVPKPKLSYKRKKAIAIVSMLCVFMIVVFSGLSIFALFLGTGSDKYPLRVTSESQFKKAINDGKSIILQKDIEINDFNIDVCKSTIDGNGHTLTINNTSTFINTLSGTIQNITIKVNKTLAVNTDFAYIKENKGTIKNVNLVISGGFTSSFSEDKYLGLSSLVLTNTDAGVIQNVQAQGNINLTSDGNVSTQFAIFAYENNGVIENCTSSTNITTSLVDTSIFAYSNLGEVKGCKNSGNIEYSTQSVSWNPFVSCIVGVNEGGSVSASENEGNITIKTSGNNNRVCAGGIAIYNYGTISYCKNIGEINIDIALSAIYAGGIAALNSSGYSHNYLCQGLIENCIFMGDINLNTSNEGAYVYMGGIVGDNSGYNDGFYYYYPGYINNSVSIINSLTVTGTCNNKYIYGLVGLVETIRGEGNVYLKDSQIDGALATTYQAIEDGKIVTKRRVYEESEGLVSKYSDIEEIKKLEIYW